MNMTYGQWLKHQRTIRGMTQTALEEAAGLSDKYVSRAENGRVELPDETTRFKIHRVLGTTEDDLVAVGLLTRMDFEGGSVYINSRNVPDTSVSHDVGMRIAERHAPEAYAELQDAGNRAVLVRALGASGLNSEQVNAVLLVVDAFQVQNTRP
jgi:transcriptional regulator with XRE-family HTH domain